MNIEQPLQPAYTDETTARLLLLRDDFPFTLEELRTSFCILGEDWNLLQMSCEVAQAIDMPVRIVARRLKIWAAQEEMTFQEVLKLFPECELQWERKQDLLHALFG